MTVIEASCSSASGPPPPTRYGRVDLLCLDELGYLQLDRRGAELLFQVLTEREERNSVAITTNEPFSGWTKTLTDPRLCAAIVDRLTFGGHILQTGTTTATASPTPAPTSRPMTASDPSRWGHFEPSPGANSS